MSLLVRWLKCAGLVGVCQRINTHKPQTLYTVATCLYSTGKHSLNSLKHLVTMDRIMYN